MRTRLLMPHAPDCFAVVAVERGEWPTPWAFLVRLEYRRSNGAKAGRREIGGRWWYVRCNDPSCHAAITVNEEDILAALEETQ